MRNWTMRKTRFAASFVLAFALLVLQVGVVLASPATQEEFITGTVMELVCDTDPTTSVTTFIVTVEDADGNMQTVRIDQLTAEDQGLVFVDEDGNPDCSEESLLAVIGMEVSIDAQLVIPDQEETQHPVGAALSTFFSDITDYDTIMSAHEDGFGFGVIAQALWLTQKLEGDSDVFLAILDAKESGNYEDFVLDDGTTPKNWGQFRKSVMDGEGNLGTVMSGQDNENGNANGNGNRNGNGNGNGNNNGNKGNDNGRGRER
jgi:hypothetical protein